MSKVNTLSALGSSGACDRPGCDQSIGAKNKLADCVDCAPKGRKAKKHTHFFCDDHADSRCPQLILAEMCVIDNCFEEAVAASKCKTCPKQRITPRSKTLTLATHEVCIKHIADCPVTYQPPEPEEEEEPGETEEAASNEPAPAEPARKRKSSTAPEGEKRAKLPKNSAARKQLAATIAATVPMPPRRANSSSSSAIPTPSTPTQTETVVIPSSPDSDESLSPPNAQPRTPSRAQEPPSSPSPTPTSPSFPSFSPSPTRSNSTPIPKSNPADPMAWMDEDSISELADRGFFLVFGIHIRDLLRSCDYHQGCGSFWRRNFAAYQDVYFEHSTNNSLGEMGSFIKVLVELNNPGDVCTVGWIAERCKDAFLARYGDDSYHQLFAVAHTDFSDARFAGVEAAKELVKSGVGAAVIRMTIV